MAAKGTMDYSLRKRIRESSTYRPGDRAVVAELPWGRLGMTVCYDLRFPGLFRVLAQAGAQFISVPSSFQRQTGKVLTIRQASARNQPPDREGVGHDGRPSGG